jgi:hypothetical protein
MPALQTSDWSACPPNTISSFLTGQRVESRRKLLVQGGALAVGSLALGWWAMRQLNLGDPQLQALSCDQFHLLVQDYLQGKLSPQEHELVVAHLAHCAHCREYVQKLQS